MPAVNISPTPWRTIPVVDSDRYEVRDVNNDGVTGWGSVSQTKPNANLIAAACEAAKMHVYNSPFSGALERKDGSGCGPP